ncbi:MAG: PssE/Cps14G family polysaccharide biosynthesis glycosyltransferase [Candidatus Thorarchaeota archaeon]
MQGDDFLIFVTVGTSLPHDGLIIKFDNLVGEGIIKDEVIAQIGAGKYIPKNIEYIRFAPSLEEYYQKADIVVSNCGAGTIMENVTKGRNLIVIQNPDVTGGHEWEIVTKMEKGGHLVWCKDIDDLAVAIQMAKTKKFAAFTPKQFSLEEIIRELA